MYGRRKYVKRKTHYAYKMVFLYVLLHHKFQKIWKFGHLVFFARINFREFVLAKIFTGINFCEIVENSRKLLHAKITPFKVYLTSMYCMYKLLRLFHHWKIWHYEIKIFTIKTRRDIFLKDFGWIIVEL